MADDPGATQGVSGEEEGGGARYRVDITEVMLTRVGDPPDHLVVQVWTPGGGLRTLRAS